MRNENYEVFLRSDLSQYVGKWIAICDGRIVATGRDIKYVFNQVKKEFPNKRPLIFKVPEKETMIF